MEKQIEKINRIAEKAKAELKIAKDLNKLNDLKVKFLGKKGELTSVINSKRFSRVKRIECIVKL